MASWLTHARHGPRCILPPRLLEHIARAGSAEQRGRALDTLARDISFRSTRLQTARMAAAVRADVLGIRREHQPQRTIHDARGEETLPGAVVRVEGGEATGDEAVDEAYAGLGDTFRLYADAYDRDSIDDEGLPLHATVHYGRGYDNAFWDGRRMVFGDGDGELFLRFTGSPEVIGHELTHGVTDDEAQLAYVGQAGALNESISDVFGSLVKQYARRQPAADADWLIGAELLGPGVQGKALRSMAEPGTAYDDPVLGTDEQPAHMRDYVETATDNGGVHINSGIPNKAFHLVATGIGGFAWETAGRIWYDALRDPTLRPTARFSTFARVTVQAASRSFPAFADTVRAAWAEVGITV